MDVLRMTNKAGVMVNGIFEGGLSALTNNHMIFAPIYPFGFLNLRCLLVFKLLQQSHASVLSFQPYSVL